MEEVESERHERASRHFYTDLGRRGVQCPSKVLSILPTDVPRMIVTYPGLPAPNIVCPYFLQQNVCLPHADHHAHACVALQRVPPASCLLARGPRREEVRGVVVAACTQHATNARQSTLLIRWRTVMVVRAQAAGAARRRAGGPGEELRRPARLPPGLTA